MTETTERKFLTANDILSAKDLREKILDVPEWEGSVTLRELTANDRDWLQASMVTEADDEGMITIENEEGRKLAITGFQTKLVALSIVHPETSKRLFDNDQIKALAEKSGIVLSRIASECVMFNKMSDDTKDLKKRGEDSAATESAASDSDSPDNSDAQLKNSETELATEN